MTCNRCGAPMSVGPSTFPGWDLLACTNCGRPVKLIAQNAPRMSGSRPGRKGDLNRALRSARRLKMRHQP